MFEFKENINESCIENTLRGALNSASFIGTLADFSRVCDMSPHDFSTGEPIGEKVILNSKFDRLRSRWFVTSFLSIREFFEITLGKIRYIKRTVVVSERFVLNFIYSVLFLIFLENVWFFSGVYGSVSPFQGSLVQSNVIMTYYWVDFPQNFKRSGKSLDFGTCDGKTLGHADVNFLKNMALDGSGVINGTMYNLGSCDCHGRFYCFDELDIGQFPYGQAADGSPLIPFVTLASNDIDPGNYFIPDIVGWPIPGKNMTHNGCVQVTDESWSFGSHHIDMFVWKIGYYNFWDDLYDSPNVDVYKAVNCDFLNYTQLNPVNKTQNSGGNNSNCNCSAQTNNCNSTTIVISGPGNNGSTVTSSVIIGPTSSKSSVQPTHTKKAFEKRKAVADVASCSGYNCYPVHILLIVSTAIVLTVPIIVVLIARWRRLNLLIFGFVFVCLYTAAVNIYCILALQAEGPLQLQLVSGSETINIFGKREFVERDVTFCSLNSKMYLISGGAGFVIAIAAFVWLLCTQPGGIEKKYYLALNKICLIVYGLTLGFFSLAAYVKFNEYSGEISHIGGGSLIASFFWGGISLAAFTFIFSLLHMSIQALGIVGFLFNVDLAKPFLFFLFAIMTILTMLFYNMKTCY